MSLAISIVIERNEYPNFYINFSLLVASFEIFSLMRRLFHYLILETQITNQRARIRTIYQVNATIHLSFLFWIFLSNIFLARGYLMLRNTSGFQIEDLILVTKCTIEGARTRYRFVWYQRYGLWNLIQTCKVKLCYPSTDYISKSLMC